MSGSVTPARTLALIESDAPVAVLDIREPLEYAYGHVPACTPVPRRDLERRLPALVPNPRTPIVLCDRRGERGAADARWLERLGYESASYVEGGMDAWDREGYDHVEATDEVHATAFNFESKAFGERIEAHEGLPKLQPDELRAMLEAEEGPRPLVLDVRTPAEHAGKTVPGSVNAEGVDLGLYAEALRADGQPVVVHCAGRTRSIIGTATLRKLGVENVYELENGTMGWELAGYELESGSDRNASGTDLDPERYDELRDSAERLAEAEGVSFLETSELDRLEAVIDERQSVYVFDVRTRAEYEMGHLPGALSLPGGQAIQTTDQHVAVRDAEIVFVSDTHVRAAITAYWFAEMGFENVSVLRGGLSGWREAGREIVEGPDERPALGADRLDELTEYVTPEELSTREARTVVVSVDTSESFEAGRVPGSRWVSRYDLEPTLGSGALADHAPVVLTCSDGTVSAYAAAQARTEWGVEDVAALSGGLSAWRAEGRPVADGPGERLVEPLDRVAPPYDQGERAMRAYLEWESNLVE